jgi:hypothetical protein
MFQIYELTCILFFHLYLYIQLLKNTFAKFPTGCWKLDAPVLTQNLGLPNLDNVSLSFDPIGGEVPARLAHSIWSRPLSAFVFIVW